MAFPTKLAFRSVNCRPVRLLEIVRGNDLYALCNVDGEVRAMAGVCPHHGGPLGQGALDGALVTCPWHAWQFDSATGAVCSTTRCGFPYIRCGSRAARFWWIFPDA